jgi:hypothetical protein
MAEAALFTGWGPPVRGREAKGLEVFGEAIGWWSARVDAGEVESFDVVLLAPHGGELAGFILAKGSDAQISALRDNEELGTLTTRAAMIVENVGVVDGVTGDGIQKSIEIYQQAIADLT